MPRIRFALGVSAENAELYNSDIEQAIRAESSRKNVWAIGSCGLGDEPGDAHVRAFESQIALASELGMPLIVEASRAYGQALTLISESGIEAERVMVRMGDCDAESLDAWVQAGCYISFGAQAADDAVRYCELARRVPCDRLLVESGAPDNAIALLAGTNPRSDQVVFVADALRGVCPPIKLAENLAAFFE